MADLSFHNDQPIATIKDKRDAWPIGVFRQEGFPTLVHLFSGGFGGWSQAHNWLSAHGMIPTPNSTVCVDADFCACSLTKATFGYQLVYPEGPEESWSNKVVANCTVDDPF